MPGHDRDLIAFDLAAERDLGLALHDPLPELGGHLLGIIGVEVQLLGDLCVGEVQAHEVQAQDPDPQRLMVPGEDGPGQVIEPLPAAVALVALPVELGVIPPVLGHLGTAALGASSPLRPPHGPDGLEALGIVDRGLDVEHHRGVSDRGLQQWVAIIRPER